MKRKEGIYMAVGLKSSDLHDTWIWCALNFITNIVSVCQDFVRNFWERRPYLTNLGLHPSISIREPLMAWRNFHSKMLSEIFLSEKPNEFPALKLMGACAVDQVKQQIRLHNKHHG